MTLLHYFFDLTSFYRLGQKYKNIFVRFLVQMKTLKSPFEINWPLVTNIINHYCRFTVRQILAFWPWEPLLVLQMSERWYLPGCQINQKATVPSQMHLPQASSWPKLPNSQPLPKSLPKSGQMYHVWWGRCHLYLSSWLSWISLWT